MMKQLLVDTTDVFGTANRSYISSQQARTASSNLGENTEPAWTKVLIFETYSTRLWQTTMTESDRKSKMSSKNHASNFPVVLTIRGGHADYMKKSWSQDRVSLPFTSVHCAQLWIKFRIESDTG